MIYSLATVWYVYANGIMSRRLPTPGSLLTKKLVSSSLQRWAACRYSVWLSLLRLARGRSVFCTFWSFSSYLLVNRLPEHMAPCGSVCSVFTKCSQWDLTTVGGDVSWYLQRIAVKWGPASGSAVSRAQVTTLRPWPPPPSSPGTLGSTHRGYVKPAGWDITFWIPCIISALISRFMRF